MGKAVAVCRRAAPPSFKAVGMAAVVAESFARIFFRNAINIALPVMVCPGIQSPFKDGNEIEIDLGAGSAKNLTVGKYLEAEPLPPNIQHILMSGGLVEVTKAKLEKRASA